MTADFTGSGRRPRAIDTTVPHSARIWNYWLGGWDNYGVDRTVGDLFIQAFPDIADIARASRAFLRRVVRYLAAEEGVRQFLDIGTGLPTSDSTHQIAQRVAPESRVVYVDNDPVVLLHAQTLLVSAPEGATDYIEADMRDPQRILAAAAETLDFSRPAGVIFVGVLGHLADDDEAVRVVRRVLDAVPSGSYLVLADGTDVVRGKQGKAAQDMYNRSGAAPYTLRSPQQLARFFDGLDILEPGLVSIPRWRPEASAAGVPPELDQFGGVARKP